MIVRGYFDDLKRIKFFFEVVNAKYDESESLWEVGCEVQNPFDEFVRVYSVIVDDESGDILEVEQLEEVRG